MPGLRHGALKRDIHMRAAFALMFIFAAVVQVSAQANNSEEILRQRLLLRERFNKGWDIQVENSKER